eukprot:Hpha_TRINITY_DN12769_c0_g2::TRINITY_DN12769_c0_g2_i1::g.114280::m.114280
MDPVQHREKARRGKNHRGGPHAMDALSDSALGERILFFRTGDFSGDSAARGDFTLPSLACEVCIPSGPVATTDKVGATEVRAPREIRCEMERRAFDWTLPPPRL